MSKRHTPARNRRATDGTWFAFRAIREESFAALAGIGLPSIKGPPGVGLVRHVTGSCLGWYETFKGSARLWHFRPDRPGAAQAGRIVPDRRSVAQNIFWHLQRVGVAHSDLRLAIGAPSGVTGWLSGGITSGQPRSTFRQSPSWPRSKNHRRTLPARCDSRHSRHAPRRRSLAPVLCRA